MRTKFFSHYFLVTFLAVSLAASLVWLESFRTPQATLSLLVIDKVSGGEAADNLIELSKNLGFYEGVLMRDDRLRDPWTGLSPDTRKAKWQTMATVTREDGSGLLRVRAWAETKDEAKLLALATTHELFGTAARYYNVKTDIDLRIVDGPVTTSEVRSYPLLIATSIGTGVLVTSIFFLVLALLDRLFRHRTNRSKASARYEELHTEKMFTPSVPSQWLGQEWDETRIPPELESEEIEPIDQEEGTKESLVPPTARTTASAPPNLPILDETEESTLSPLAGALSRLVRKDIDETQRERVAEENQTLPEASPRVEEPTTDEYRRRLNELLSGTLK